jgi:hypothetical protein
LAAPRPGVFEFEDADTAFDAVDEIGSALAARGFHASLTNHGTSVVLPPPFEVRHGSFAGRTLRGEEYDPYARACTDIASFVAPSRVLIEVEEMHVFDWHVFTPAHWSVLSQLYPTLPGWLGDDGGVPMWFGRDEKVGPYGSASNRPDFRWRHSRRNRQWPTGGYGLTPGPGHSRYGRWSDREGASSGSVPDARSFFRPADLSDVGIDRVRYRKYRVVREQQRLDPCVWILRNFL